MLLAEDGLETLLAQLSALPAGDRRGILARLSPRERALVAARMRGAQPETEASPLSPHSPDIAGRIAALDGDGDAPMTAPAREALRRAIAQQASAPPRRPGPSASLADTLGGVLGLGRGRP